MLDVILSDCNTAYRHHDKPLMTDSPTLTAEHDALPHDGADPCLRDARRRALPRRGDPRLRAHVARPGGRGGRRVRRARARRLPHDHPPRARPRARQGRRRRADDGRAVRQVDRPGRGKGGSMHVADPAIGILGANAIVGAGMPLAVGAGAREQAAQAGPRRGLVLRRGRGQPGLVPRVAQPRGDLGPARASSCARTTSTPSSATAAG